MLWTRTVTRLGFSFCLLFLLNHKASAGSFVIPFSQRESLEYIISRVYDPGNGVAFSTFDSPRFTAFEYIFPFPPFITRDSTIFNGSLMYSVLPPLFVPAGEMISEMRIVYNPLQGGFTGDLAYAGYTCSSFYNSSRLFPYVMSCADPTPIPNYLNPLDFSLTITETYMASQSSDPYRLEFQIFENQYLRVTDRGFIDTVQQQGVTIGMVWRATGYAILGDGLVPPNVPTLYEITVGTDVTLSGQLEYDTVPLPEPAGALGMASGLAGLMVWGRRMRSKD